MTKQEEADARLGFAALARGGLIPPPPPGPPYDVIETDRPGWSNIVGLTRYLVGQASDPPDRRELRPPLLTDACGCWSTPSRRRPPMSATRWTKRGRRIVAGDSSCQSN